MPNDFQRSHRQRRPIAGIGEKIRIVPPPLRRHGFVICLPLPATPVQAKERGAIGILRRKEEHRSTSRDEIAKLPRENVALFGKGRLPHHKRRLIPRDLRRASRGQNGRDILPCRIRRRRECRFERAGLGVVIGHDYRTEWRRLIEDNVEDIIRRSRIRGQLHAAPSPLQRLVDGERLPLQHELVLFQGRVHGRGRAIQDETQRGDQSVAGDPRGE